MKKRSLLFFSIIFFIEILNAQYTKLIDFNDTVTGSYPYDTFISDGTYLYGTTHLGGKNNGGTLFKIKSDGSAFTKILDFNDTINGSFPRGSFYYDGEFLFGTTAFGGAYDKGTIFKIKPDGSGYKKLLDFAGITNGSNPGCTLISDGSFLYGTTTDGGANSNGIVFKIMPDGSGFSKLLDFAGYSNGSKPNCSLIYDGTFLYGMTTTGGATATTFYGGDGTIFRIKPDGSNYMKLLDFSSATTGDFPLGSLFSDGTYLYGMTRQGGKNGQGTIFKIKPDGSNYTKLLDFDGSTKGCVPSGSLIFANGFIYGMTWGCGINNYGTIFRIKPDGSNYEIIWDFIDITLGGNPYSTLFYNSPFLLGMTYGGGINNNGVVFKFDPTIIDIKENSINKSVEIYPNPTSNNFIVKTPEKATIHIIDINGNIIKTIYQSKWVTSIDMTTCSSGVYIIKIKTNHEIIIKKLIKE